MGGYAVALLASLEADLRCAIAGIAVSDWAGILWHHLPSQARLELEHAGLAQGDVNELYRPISPFSFEARLAPERLTVFAAAADRIVPPHQTLALMEHWRPQRALWYQGSHLSVMADAGVRSCIRDALSSAGLVRSG